MQTLNTIAGAYSGQNLPGQGNLVAHFTKGMATSAAAEGGSSFTNAAATWSAPCLFTKFYRVNLASSASPAPLGSAVLLSAAGQAYGTVESPGPCDTDGTSHLK